MVTILRKIIAVVASIALAVTFVGAGFAVCTLPPVTQGLANMFSDDATSPFNRNQLVQVADATRDYSFGSHSKGNLYRAIYQVDMQLKQQLESSGATVPADFPKLDLVTDPSDPMQVEAAFTTASEMYCYSRDTVSHLDDCHNIASTARPLLIALALIGVVGLVAAGALGGKRKAGNILLAAGSVVIVAFLALGAWAVIDFDGFFTTFHGVFFSQGNWTFPYDSLLICALPTAFWMGMGAVWLATSALVSILSIVISKRLR